MYPPDLHGALRTRLDPYPRAIPQPGDRLAAVLIALIDRGDGEPTVILTRRSDGLSRHAGEISFPGGIVDAGDAGPAAAALREADEELGIDPASVDVLGALEPVHTFVSRILVVPFVGVLNVAPVLHPDPGEIAAVFEVPISELLSVEAQVEFEVPGDRAGNDRWRGWAYETGGGRAWGATGVMLHRFLEHVRAIGRGSA